MNISLRNFDAAAAGRERGGKMKGDRPISRRVSSLEEGGLSGSSLSNLYLARERERKRKEASWGEIEWWGGSPLLALFSSSS